MEEHSVFIEEEKYEPKAKQSVNEEPKCTKDDCPIPKTEGLDDRESENDSHGLHEVQAAAVQGVKFKIEDIDNLSEFSEYSFDELDFAELSPNFPNHTYLNEKGASKKLLCE